MKLSHHFGSFSVTKDVEQAPFVFLSNHQGSYFLSRADAQSRYHGFFFYDSALRRMFRTVESLTPLHNEPIEEIENHFGFVRRKRASFTEEIFAVHDKHSLVHHFSNPQHLLLSLDVKESYDNREFGRIYRLEQRDNVLLVHFTKEFSQEEDGSTGEEYHLTVAVTGFTQCTLREQWIKKEYQEDRKRHSSPDSRYVFLAAELEGQTIVCSVSYDTEKAIKECKDVLAHRQTLLTKQQEFFHRYYSTPCVQDVLKHPKFSQEMRMAYLCCMNSLQQMVVAKTGEVFAGYPWFFQEWSRDTLTSLRGLSFFDESLTHKILVNYLHSIQKDGRVFNHARLGGKTNADGIGWLFLRASTHLDSESYVGALTRTLRYLKTSHVNKHLLGNGSQETWMDTQVPGRDNGRGGFRIEIQAMYLFLLELAFWHTKQDEYLEQKTAVKKRVRELFFKQDVLYDGLHDPTLRPNIFLAYYFYPELLSVDEWNSCFEKALPSLWLSWGGLSSIDASHPLFIDMSSGESRESYHFGDSWYWVNNLAALCLCRLGHENFDKYIDTICSASMQEILWQGVMGGHSEVSSATSLESEGCVNQAWSNALFLELVAQLMQR